VGAAQHDASRTEISSRDYKLIQQRLQTGVAAVAEGRIFAVLAAAEIDGFGLGGVELHGGEVAALVAAVAEGLLGALAAGAPVIAFPSFDFHRIRTRLGNGWF